MSKYNLTSCSDIDTLNQVFATLMGPYHDAFNEATAEIEKQYNEECAPALAVFDAAVKEVHDTANMAWRAYEQQQRQQMESIRLEALRRIRRIEDKLKQHQAKIQAAYYAEPVVVEAQAALKAATAEAEARRDAAIQPFYEELLRASADLREEYQEALKVVPGGTLLNKVSAA